MKRTGIKISKGELKEICLAITYALDNCFDHNYPYTSLKFRELQQSLLKRAGYSSYFDFLSHE